MEYINKIEAIVGGWLKNVPHLPAAGQKWLGQNVWWIALIGAIAAGIGVLGGLVALFTTISLVGSLSSTYYVTQTVTSWAVVTAAVSLAFLVLQGLLLAIAVKPLKDLQKKGWVLLFTTLLVQAASVVVSAVLTLNVAGFLIGIIFGAVGLAIGAYFVYEIRGQFAQVSKPATKAAAKKA